MTAPPQTRRAKRLLNVGTEDRHVWVDPVEVAVVRAAGHDVLVVLRCGVDVVARHRKYTEPPAGPEDVDEVVHLLAGGATS